MLIYLIRHLPTAFNKSGVYMGRSNDVPILSETIFPFEKRLKGYIGHLNGSVFVGSSPALRCIQTVTTLSQTLGISTKLHVYERLNEMNYGDFEGKSSQEIKIHYPQEYRKWMEHPSLIHFPGGESFAEVQKRGVSCLKEIISTEIENIFLVTHVDIIKMIVCSILDIPIDSKRMFKIDNGSISCLETTNEKYNKKKIKVRYVNCT